MKKEADMADACRGCDLDVAEDIHPRLGFCAECMYSLDVHDAEEKLRAAQQNDEGLKYDKEELLALEQHVKDIKGRDPQFYYDIIDRANREWEIFPDLSPEATLMDITMEHLRGIM